VSNRKITNTASLSNPAGLDVSIDATNKPSIITLGDIFNLSIRNHVWVEEYYPLGTFLTSQSYEGNDMRLQNTDRNTGKISTVPMYFFNVGSFKHIYVL